MMEQMMKQMMGNMPFGEMPFGKMPFGEMPFGKMPSGEMPFGKMPFGKMPFGDMSLADMQIGKQMIDAYKAMFDNMFNAMAMMQDQNEKMVSMFLDQATWLPEQGKKQIIDLVQAAKKGQDELKKFLDDNLKKMGGVVCTPEKPKPAAAKNTKK
jgi:polyhydroxyalkanoate synthesis regulator phasin